MSVVDARGLLCPLPVLKLRKKLMSVAPGTRITLRTTDAAAQIDVPHFCAEGGHVLVSSSQCDAVWDYVVERGPIRAI